MTLETTKNEVDEVVVEGEDEGEQSEAPQLTELEQQVQADGWVPKEDWVKSGKNPDEWRSAREFKERGEFFGQIKTLQTDLKKTNAAFRAMLEHHKNVEKVATDEAIKRLKAERKAAAEDNDVGRVLAIDDTIDEIKARPPSIPKIDLPEPTTGPSQDFKDWHRQNKWYSLDADNDESEYANVVGNRYKASHPNASETDLLEHVSKKIRNQFPDLFENQERKKPSEVRGSKERQDGDDDSYQLTAQEKEIMDYVTRNSKMTKAQFIKELKMTKGR